jgi:hypothetical protein
MGSAYSDEQYTENYPDGIEHHYWNVARNDLVRRTIINQPGRLVLDVGCGRGVVVGYLRAKGIECLGCEIGTPRPLTPGVAPYLMLGTDACDVESAVASRVTQLLFLDVLEHVGDPQAMLTSARRHFQNVRRITITLPACRELWTNYDDRFGHVMRYDADDTRQLVECLEPKGIRTFYFFHALYPAIRALAAAGMKRETKVSVPVTPAARLSHRLAGVCLRMSDRCLPAWLPGSSIAAVVDL